MKEIVSFFFFFFSSRRRHTRCSRDWSSDVCSSDLDVPFFPRIPLPTEVLNRPLVDLESGREEVVEPVVSDQLVHRAPDGAFCAGTLTDDGVLNGGAQGVELLVGLLLEQVQGAPLLAIEGGAKADQEFAVNPAQAGVGLGGHLDSPSVRKRQGVTLPQGNLGKRTHPGSRNRGQEGELGLCEQREVVKRDVALIHHQGEAGGYLLRETLAGEC